MRDHACDQVVRILIRIVQQLCTQGSLFRGGDLAAALQKPRIKRPIRLSRHDNENNILGGRNRLANTNNENIDNPSSTFAESPDEATIVLQQTTGFVDDAVESYDVLSSSSSHISDLDTVSTIKNFLARPSEIYRGRISGSSPVLLPLGALGAGTQTSFAHFHFPYDAMTNTKLKKVSQFRFFKADVRLRILISANPFIAGKLYVTIAPNNWITEEINSIRWKGRRGVTSYPGKEIDLQTATATDMLIPWCSIKECLDLTEYDVADWSSCRVDIWCLTAPLVASNTPVQTVPIQVFAHFENVELKVPTIYDAVLQINEAPGPITQVATSVSGIAQILEPHIPKIATPIRWFSNLVSGVASNFGWSRPIDGKIISVTNIPGRGLNNFSATDQSVVLGMSSDNYVENSVANLNSPDDEMSVEYACRRPCLVQTANWTTGDDYGTTLVSQPVGPYAYGDQHSLPSGLNVVDMGVGDYVIEHFGYFRADSHFRISVVKTKFHVGRLEVVYVPRAGAVLSNTDDTTDMYREVFDITDHTDIHFVVPFNATKMMIKTGSGFETEQGRIIVRVVAPLNAPETVTQSVAIHVWKWYENVAVTGTLGHLWYPWGHVDAQDAVLQINTERTSQEKFVALRNENDAMTGMNVCKVVGGETCVSLRAATRAYRRMDLDVALVAARPSRAAGGYVAMCSNIYVYFRGGMGYKFIRETAGHLFTTLSEDIATHDKRHLPTHYTHSSVTPVHEVVVPFYSEYRRQVCNAVSSLLPYFQPYIEIYDEKDEAPNVISFAGGKDDLDFSFLIGPPILNAVDRF